MNGIFNVGNIRHRIIFYINGRLYYTHKWALLYLMTFTNILFELLMNFGFVGKKLAFQTFPQKIPTYNPKP